ncbi:MAG: hypothetical protein WDM70_11560 [Nitrosomonadales bacterium]
MTVNGEVAALGMRVVETM